MKTIREKISYACFVVFVCTIGVLAAFIITKIASASYAFILELPFYIQKPILFVWVGSVIVGFFEING